MPTENAGLSRDDLAELDMYRVGHNQLTVDPMRAGQPIHEIYEYAEGESTYWLQQTHRGMPIWACMTCGRVSVGARSGCGECGTDHGDDLTPVLYEAKPACRSWAISDGGGYDGRCLIGGSDGCGCGWCPGIRIPEVGPDGRYVAAPCGVTTFHGGHWLDGRDDLATPDNRPKLEQQGGDAR